MPDKSIINVFRSSVHLITESKQLQWNKYLDAWENWTDYINHTNAVIRKYDLLLLFLMPWYIYRNYQTDKLLNQMNQEYEKCLKL